MDPVYERCCGLDIHKDTIVACLRTPDSAGRPQQEIRTFGTVTEEILALGDWLAKAGGTHVAMEATGVYWIPVYDLLEAEGFRPRRSKTWQPAVLRRIVQRSDC